MRISTANFKRFIVLQGTLRLGPGGVRCRGHTCDGGSQPVPWRQGRAGGSPCLDGTRSRDSSPQAWQSHVVNQFKGRQPLLRNTRVENEKLPPGSDEYMGATSKTTAEVSSPARFACYHRITKTQPETWNYLMSVRGAALAPHLLCSWRGAGRGQPVPD